MQSLFDAHLINPPFGDPGACIDFRLQRRSMLFDLGDNTPLLPRKLMRISHAFVSHTHMDHFIGFDRLLRVCLGRHAGIHLFGPPGFVAQVEHRLAAYTWNLVDNYATDYAVTATEIDAAGEGQSSARFRARARFRREDMEPLTAAKGVLLEEEDFRLRYARLDHRTPCLGFCLEEKLRVSVSEERLAAMGLHTGPWLKDLKRAVLAGASDEARLRAWWLEHGRVHEREVLLGELKQGALQLLPGAKICYVTDVVFHDDNFHRIVELARGADLLFIESVFLDADARHAREKQHLTASQAGTIACAAGAKVVIPFHFSPRYIGREAELRAELSAALGAEQRLA